jgi:hypothetical protein
VQESVKPSLHGESLEIVAPLTFKSTRQKLCIILDFRISAIIPVGSALDSELAEIPLRGKLIAA